MKVRLAYGVDGLDVEVPDDATVVVPTDPPALDDEAGAVRSAVAPLGDVVRPGKRVAVVFPDLTRPMPNRTILPPLLEELERMGAGTDDIVLLCATGTHRQATAEEMSELVGPEIAARYRIVDHDSVHGEHVEVGMVDGAPILIDTEWVEADVRITTGFVEPHFFAGFSGGPKGVCPGLAALETILEAHSPKRIANLDATWTILDGNPVHEFVARATALAPPTMSIDVAIDSKRRLTGVWAGQLPEAHRAACAFAEQTAVRHVPSRFDVVVTTNAGHPLDRNLYQAVKGMAAAERVVASKGTIIAAAACADGVPDGGEFGRLVRAASDPRELLNPDAPRSLDRWQAQVLGRVLQRAEVALYTEGIDADDIRACHLKPVGSVDAAVNDAVRRRGRDATVCVLPLGPLTVATPGASG